MLLTSNRRLFHYFCSFSSRQFTRFSSTMIRSIQKEDFGKICSLMDKAFANSKYESTLVHNMSNMDENVCGWAYINESSELLGCIIYTPATNEGKRIGWHLAPLAVHPSIQRTGVGSRLIRESLSSPLLASSPIFVLGSPTYYSKFGFAAVANPLCKYDPGNRHFMALRWLENQQQFNVGYCDAFQLTDNSLASNDAVVATSDATPINAEQYLTAAANELVAIVNRDNEVVGSARREDMRKQKMIHRATFAFVRNSGNYFFVQKRSMLKDYCPGFYDPTPGGVVAAGESYGTTNAREMEEEMGIPSATCRMEHLFTFFYEDDRVSCFGDAWAATYDGELKLQPEEVDSVELMSMEDILRRHEAGENFTPDSIFACKEYVRRYGMPTILS